MDLQTAFYITGIIFMAGWIIIMILIAAFIITVQQTVKKAPEKIQEIVSNLIEEHKSSLIGMAGMTIVPFILKGLKKKIFGK